MFSQRAVQMSFKLKILSNHSRDKRLLSQFQGTSIRFSIGQE